jgi:hypothetical protein
VLLLRVAKRALEVHYICGVSRLDVPQPMEGGVLFQQFCALRALVGCSAFTIVPVLQGVLLQTPVAVHGQALYQRL